MSDNVRVYEIAEEAGATSAEVITKAKDLSIELKSPQSTVSFEDAEEIANYIMKGKSSKLPKKEVKKKPIIKNIISVIIIEGIVVNAMYLMCVIKSVPDIAGAKFVVSDNGDILSPK